MKQALIVDGKVANLIEATPEESQRLSGQWVDATNEVGVDIGWSFSNGSFTPPATVQRYRKVLKTYEFIELFTPAEYKATENLIGVNAEITKAYRRADSKGTVNLDSPKAGPVMAEFVREGVLTAERAAEIAQGIPE